MQAAGGGPPGMGEYARRAMALFDNGYEPIPIRPGSKVPAISRWSTVTIDAAQVDRWIAMHPQCGVGLRTGHLVGLDIDILDADLAWRIMDLANRRLGTSLMRVGQWPKRLLLYRTQQPFPKIDAKPLEVLGQGQQFVAFGRHPGTGADYGWPLGETPLDVPRDDLPVVDHDRMLAFVAEARAILPDMAETAVHRGRRTGTGGGRGILRNDRGRVVDGRDGWLSRIAFHTVHDAIDRNDDLALPRLAGIVWDRFEASTDLTRPRQDGGQPWGPRDALRKVRDKLRLHGQGDLPPRQASEIEADHVAPTRTADEARVALERKIAGFLADVRTWHAESADRDPPNLAVRATTGLGKSSVARRLIADLRRYLADLDLPDRILVFVPSHDLAEEAAERWRDLGCSVAVLRGYERRHPQNNRPMCADVEAIRATLASALDPHSTVCVAQGGLRCPHFGGCLKQRNRDEVADADIVLAPYDALFTGFAVDPATIGLIVIDEAFWGRAWARTSAITVEGLTTDVLGTLGTGLTRTLAAGRMADRKDLRTRLQCALAQNGPGAVTAGSLRRAGLSGQDCMDAARLEEHLLDAPGLVPGLSGSARKTAFRISRNNQRVRCIASVWRAAARLLDTADAPRGRLVVGERDDKTGTHAISVIAPSGIDTGFAGKPILHLDATMRAPIVDCLLPGAEKVAFEAAAPHMAVHLVTGRFSKSTMIATVSCAPDERIRRERRLAAIVDHVRWHARRLAPGRLLVITHKAIEDTFAEIPGVETGHFNAMAGLDAYGDVAAVFIVGRPLPSSAALPEPCAALFGAVVDGAFMPVRRAVRMRDGSSRIVRTLAHPDETAELVRSAICDDELIQCIGRGRGVNRTAGDPLEVHVLADVALPLVHDSVVDWDTIRPDFLQCMLLKGIAVDSPSDAARLHPDLFRNQEQAKKLFARSGLFKGQTPYNIYRGLSLKSASYRHPGRGRSWQTACWIADRDLDPREDLEAIFGSSLEWCAG